MAFIKVDNMIVNTAYIAAVRLGGQDTFGDETVSLLIAIPTFPLHQQETNSTTSTNFYQYEWVEFTGFAAIALTDYFSSFNNVIDLMPQNHNKRSLSNSKEISGN
jgi:hypothetical protein